MQRRERLTMVLSLLAGCQKAPLALQDPVAIQLHVPRTQIGIDIEIQPPVGFKREMPMNIDENWSGEPFDVVVTSDPERQHLHTLDAPCGAIDDSGGTLEILGRTKTERGVQATCERRNADGKVRHFGVIRLEQNIETVVSCEIHFETTPAKHIRETAETVCASLKIKGRSSFIPFRERPKPRPDSGS
jgi:hypothetical protein